MALPCLDDAEGYASAISPHNSGMNKLNSNRPPSTSPEWQRPVSSCNELSRTSTKHMCALCVSKFKMGPTNRSKRRRQEAVRRMEVYPEIYFFELKPSGSSPLVACS